MKMYDIIQKKKQGQVLTTQEINYVVEKFTSHDIPKYQMSSLLMAICLNGMTMEETVALTMAMTNSGETLDLSSLPNKTIDKHSTGGVGDKTTLIVGPILAALGLSVAKMSGRSLGHTGGTVDKLESIPGLRMDFSPKEFLEIAASTGICLASQTANLVPADKLIYNLRDQTATVDSIPLIAASIMSKKLAAGAQHILLDVKWGRGAFMKNLDSARELAKTMVEIGNRCGRKTAAVITDMSAPLGYAVGNAVEVREAVQILSAHPQAPKDITELSIKLSAYALQLVEGGTFAQCCSRVEAVIENGAALQKFKDMVVAQGVKNHVAEKLMEIFAADVGLPVNAKKSGYVTAIDAEAVGAIAGDLARGDAYSTKIRHLSGALVIAKVGDAVQEAMPLAVLCIQDAATEKNDMATLVERLHSAFTISDTPPPEIPLICEVIGL